MHDATPTLRMSLPFLNRGLMASDIVNLDPRLTIIIVRESYLRGHLLVPDDTEGENSVNQWSLEVPEIGIAASTLSSFN